MTTFDKRALSERDICTKFIMPALTQAGWDPQLQVREQVYFTKGRVIVRGKTVSRGERKFADFILFYKPNVPIAVIEAKDNSHTVGAGMQQALDYAATLDVPFVFSSNGDGFLEHDRTVKSGVVERELPLDGFPSPGELWQRYCQSKGLESAQQKIVTQDYHDDGTQIGMTATPKETEVISNIDYFGDPLFVYSLRQGIEDGFLAPYKVIRIYLDKDVKGWQPGQGRKDKHGKLIENRKYEREDMDRTLVLEKRTELVARKVTEYLKMTDRFHKTIVFCEDIEHADSREVNPHVRVGTSAW